MGVGVAVGMGVLTTPPPLALTALGTALAAAGAVAAANGVLGAAGDWPVTTT